MILKVRGIETLELSCEHINLWSKNRIYPFGQEEYFKMLNSSYQDLQIKKNKERLEILNLLSEIKDTRYLVLPKCIFVTKNEVLGYSMNVSLGKTLEDLDDNISYKKVVLALGNLLEDIRRLSKFGILNPDIWSSNVLFDGDNLYLIDFDDSILFENKKQAYKMMGMSLFSLILDKIITPYSLDTLNDKDINYIKNGIDTLKTEDYIAFLNLLRLKLSRLYNQDIENLGQVRKVLKLVQNGFD